VDGLCGESGKKNTDAKAMTLPDLGVIILTHNEELHIARALKAIAPIASQVVVVDSYSTDRTVELARSLGAKVLQNKFVNYAKQFQWALENSALDTEWVMRLDADEIVEPDLAQEITEKLPHLSEEVSGINLRRKHIFLGKWIRHGGRYPLILLRIWRRGRGRIEDRWMDEHMIVESGTTVTFDGGFSDHNLNDLTFFTVKHNSYATREAIDIINSRRHLFFEDKYIKTTRYSFQAKIKRIIKENAYNKTPFYVASTLYFLYRYLIQLGFLDGIEGLIYHFLQGFWYRFLVGAKTVELERAIAHISEKDEIINELSRLTGYRLKST
jgi:glycosyltransferase involved in cell wall biosynthesis